MKMKSSTMPTVSSVRIHRKTQIDATIAQRAARARNFSGDNLSIFHPRLNSAHSRETDRDRPNRANARCHSGALTKVKRSTTSKQTVSVLEQRRIGGRRNRGARTCCFRCKSAKIDVIQDDAQELALNIRGERKRIAHRLLRSSTPPDDDR